MQEKDFDSYIKDSIDSLEIEPPTHSWDNIERKLNSSRRNKRIAYISFAGLAASIALLLTLNNIIPSEEYTTTRTLFATNQTIKPNNTIATVETEELPETEFISINRKRREYIYTVKTHESVACLIDSELKLAKKIGYLDERSIINANIARTKTKKHIEIAMNLGSGNSSAIESAPMIMRSSALPLVSEFNDIAIPKYKSKLHTNLNIRISYPISNRISLVSGLGYLGFSSTFENKYYYGDINEFYNTDFTNIESGSIADVDQNFAYLELPLLIKYSIIKKRISMYMSAGLGLDYLISNSSKIYFSDNTTTDTSSKSLKDFTSCGLVSIGLSTPIYKSFSINVEGQYRYFFMNISKNKILETKQSMPGLSFGLSYKF